MDSGYTVIGYWPGNGERYGDFYDADNARDAERRMQRDADSVNQGFRVAGILHGAPDCADLYTRYVDPQDPRNLDAEDLEADSEELRVTEWSVMGLLLDGRDMAWNRRTGGQRYLEVVDALSPLAAEDVARSRAGDQGARLVVCAVFRGRVQRADPYAVFSDPDIRPDNERQLT